VQTCYAKWLSICSGYCEFNALFYVCRLELSLIFLFHCRILACSCVVCFCCHIIWWIKVNNDNADCGEESATSSASLLQLRSSRSRSISLYIFNSGAERYVAPPPGRTATWLPLAGTVVIRAVSSVKITQSTTARHARSVWWHWKLATKQSFTYLFLCYHFLRWYH